MNSTPTRLRRLAPWAAGAALCALSLIAGAWALSERSAFDYRSLLGVVGRDAGPRAAVAVGAVANATGLGGDEVISAARRGVDDALREHANVSQVALAERGARVAAVHGHVLDVNVVRIERQPGRLLAEASVVVSSLPGREYEFASSSTVTLSGSTADTDQAVADAVRRAMRSATSHAVEQMSAR